MPRKSKKPKDCGCGRGPVYCISKTAVVKEHVDLLETLTNPTSKKLKKEAGEQSAELARILKPVPEKKGKGKSPMEIALLMKRKDRKIAGMEHLPITTGEVEAGADDLEKALQKKKRQTERERVARLRSRQAAEHAVAAGAVPLLDFAGLGRRRLKGGYNTGLKSQADAFVGRVNMEEFGDPKYKPIASQLDEQVKALVKIDAETPHIEPVVIQQLQNDLKKAKDALAAYKPPDAKLMTDELRRERVQTALEALNPDGSCADNYMKANHYDEYMLGPSEMDLADATQKIEEAREESAVIVATDARQRATELAESLPEQQKEDMLEAINKFYQLPSILELEKYKDILSGKYTPAMAEADAVQDLDANHALLSECKQIEDDWQDARQEYQSGFLASMKPPFEEVNPLVLPTICQRAYSKTTARAQGSKKEYADFLKDFTNYMTYYSDGMDGSHKTEIEKIQNDVAMPYSQKIIKLQAIRTKIQDAKNVIIEKENKIIRWNQCERQIVTADNNGTHDPNLDGWILNSCGTKPEGATETSRKGTPQQVQQRTSEQYMADLKAQNDVLSKNFPTGSGRPISHKEFIQNLLDELKENDCGCGCNGENKPSKLRGGALDECPAGYDNHGLTCLEQCNSNEVDTGLFCMGPKTCPEGQRDDGTSCWYDLRCETHWNPQCFYWDWFGGYWTGCAVTTCNGGPRVQTKQTRAKRIVGRVNWAKTGEEIRSGFQAAFGPDSALARAFDPEKNGVAKAFRDFGRMAADAFKAIGRGLQTILVSFLSGDLLFGQIFDFIGGIGQAIEGKISGAALGNKFLGAISQVVSIAAMAVTGGASGVLLRVLSSGLKVMGNVASGKPPSATEIAELAANLLPSGASKLGKWGSRMREAIEIGVNFLPHETEEVAGETFANASESSVQEPKFTQEQVDEAEAKLVDARDTLQKMQFVDTAKIEIGRRATEEAQVWCQFKDMAKTLYPDDITAQNSFANKFLDSAMGNRPRAAAMKEAYLKAEKKKEPTPEEKLTAALNYFRNKETTDESDAAEIDSIIQSFSGVQEQKYSDEYYALHKEEIDDEVATERAAIIKDATDILEGAVEKVQDELDEKLATNAAYEAAIAPVETKIKKLIEDYNAERGKDTAAMNKQPEFQKKYGISFAGFDNQPATMQQSMYEQFMNPISMDITDNGTSMDIIADFIAAGGKPKFRPSSGVPPLRPTLPSAPAPAPAPAPASAPKKTEEQLFQEQSQQDLADMEAYGNSLGGGRRKKKATQLEGAGYWKDLIRTELERQVQGVNEFLENYNHRILPRRVTDRFINTWTTSATRDIKQVGKTWLRWIPLASRTTLEDLESTEPNPRNVGDRPEARRANAVRKNEVVQLFQTIAAENLTRIMERVLRNTHSVPVEGRHQFRQPTAEEARFIANAVRYRFLLPPRTQNPIPFNESMAVDTMSLDDLKDGDDVVVITPKTGVKLTIKLNRPMGWREYRNHMDRQAAIERRRNEAHDEGEDDAQVEYLGGELVDTVERGIVRIVPERPAETPVEPVEAGEDAWDEEEPAEEQNAELAEILEGEGKPRRKKSKRV